MNYSSRFNNSNQSHHQFGFDNRQNNNNYSNGKDCLVNGEKSPFMPYPITVKSSANNMRNATSSRYSIELQKEAVTISDKNDLKKGTPPFGSSPAEKLCVFTGTIDRAIKWHKILTNRMCLYEVIASIVSMQNGSVKLERVILLRDDKGPIMQVVHYLTHDLQLDDFSIGQKVRVVGRMIGYNKLNAISIRSASIQEIESLQRHCHIGDYAISRILKDDERTAGENVLLH